MGHKFAQAAIEELEREMSGEPRPPCVDLTGAAGAAATTAPESTVGPRPDGAEARKNRGKVQGDVAT